MMSDATDTAVLVALEDSLWRPETRFDRALMERTFAPEFFEFGRSGRVWTRTECLDAPPQPFSARLTDIAVRYVTPDVAQVTYKCVGTFDGVELPGNRSSLWRRTGDTWQLVFHQGTPTS